MNDMQIQCFLAAAQTLSFTKAAEGLFISQQGMSKQISNLEEELGAVLFERAGSRLRLTEAGEAYRELFIRQTERYRVCRDAARAKYRTLGTHLCVGYSEWLDPYGRLDRALMAFRQSHPSVELYARVYPNRELFDRLKSGALDVALISGEQVIGDALLRFDEIAPERLCLYVPEWIEDECVDERCWGLPMLQAPSWEWNYFLKNRVFGAEKRLGADAFALRPESYCMLPNLQSMLAELARGRSVAYGESRFGCIGKTPFVRPLPLEETGSQRLCAVSDARNENPLAAEYTAFLTAYFENED